MTYSGGGDAFRPPLQSLIVTDRKGNKLNTVAEEVLLGTPRFSPDGNRILFTNSSSASIGHNLWVYDLARGIKTPLTSGDKLTSYSDPVWSSDGRRIAFAKYGPGKYSVYMKNADGSGPEQAVTADSIVPIWPRDWSSDQKVLALVTGVSFRSDKVQFLDVRVTNPSRSPLLPLVLRKGIAIRVSRRTESGLPTPQMNQDSRRSW